MVEWNTHYLIGIINLNRQNLHLGRHNQWKLYLSLYILTCGFSSKVQTHTSYVQFESILATLQQDGTHLGTAITYLQISKLFKWDAIW